MFETTFSYASSTPLPPNTPIDRAKESLHNFELVIRCSPDSRSCKRIDPPTTVSGQAKEEQGGNSAAGPLEHYEVEDNLPFVPKSLWSGGVRYRADFRPTDDGCDITIYAPGGFTSINHWRILRDSVPEDVQAEKSQSQDAMHADAGIGGWYIQIVTDTKCSWTFAALVKGYLKNSHTQLQTGFIEKLQNLPPE